MHLSLIFFHNKVRQCFAFLDEETQSSPQKSSAAAATTTVVDRSHDVMIIEPSTSPPITVSDMSIKNRQEDPKTCNPFLCPLPQSSSSNSSEPGTSKACRGEPIYQSCSSSQTPNIYLRTKKESSGSRTMKIQVSNCKCKYQQCPDETRTDVELKRCDASTVLCQCKHAECQQTSKVKNESASKIKTVKKELVTRPCYDTQDSGGVSSMVDSATSAPNVRVGYCRNKLRSALEIIQNKEKTIRVQNESLAIAEGRISNLTERAAELKRELDRKTKELQYLRKKLQCSCHVEKVEVSISADTEMEHQSDIVSTLQDNLSVIEELYRECFYETAKQEDLIDMLRMSYMDVRVMDKQKADQIERLQTVINKQKCSLDKCQDIALEVDNLKSEICNFLSSSTSTNNDSGMWERSEESLASVPGVQEELQEVMEQLLTLRELLTLDNASGLQEEVVRLKRENKMLETKIQEICQNQCDVHQALQIKDSLEKQYKKQLEIKEEQLGKASLELEKLVAESREKHFKHEILTAQVQQMQALLETKGEELAQMQRTCDSQQETITHIRQELKKAENLCQENCKIRCEVSHLTSQVAQWREQLANSECRVRKLDAKLRHTQDCYKKKESDVSELQAELQAAHARGAQLCADARRALGAVRHWARRMRDRHREHERLIKEKDLFIATLQHQVEDHHTGNRIAQCDRVEDAPSSKGLSSSRQSSCCSNLEPRRYSKHSCSCQSEIASCSSVPIPPKRHLRNKGTRGNKEVSPMVSWLDASVQNPSQQELHQDPCCQRSLTTSRAVSSPADELFMRVEQLSKAFAAGYRRWSRSDPR